MPTSLLRSIQAYKHSSILLAAFQLKLFELLSVRPATLADIAQSLQLDEEMLSALLLYLENEQFVACVDSEYRLTDAMLPYLRNLQDSSAIIELELFNYYHTNTPDNIMRIIQKGEEANSHRDEMKCLYYKAMFGRSCGIFSLMILRELHTDSLRHCVEISMYPGRIAALLAERLVIDEVWIVCEQAHRHLFEGAATTGHIHLCSLDSLDRIDAPGCDLVILYNYLHYYPKEQLAALTEKLKAMMDKRALFVIIDIFLDRGQEMTYLVDWMTHGGTRQLFLSDAISILQEGGFTDITTRKVPGYPATMIFARL